jgi:hypothetical protein
MRGSKLDFANANMIGVKRDPSTDIGVSADRQDHGLVSFGKRGISLKAKRRIAAKRIGQHDTQPLLFRVHSLCC